MSMFIGFHAMHNFKISKQVGPDSITFYYLLL